MRVWSAVGAVFQLALANVDANLSKYSSHESVQEVFSIRVCIRPCTASHSRFRRRVMRVDRLPRGMS
jgi:hypothetical protein